MSQRELARRMGRPYQAVNEIVNGKKAVTAGPQSTWNASSAATRRRG